MRKESACLVGRTVSSLVRKFQSYATMNSPRIKLLPVWLGLLLGLTLSNASADVLVKYPFGKSGDETTYEGATNGYYPSNLVANLTASLVSDPMNTIGIEISSAATTPANAPFLRTDPQAAVASAAAAVTANKYFQFTLNANTGYIFTATNLSFNGARGGAGTPRGYAVRSSADGFAANLSSADFATARPTYTAVSIPLVGAAFANTNTLTFRVYIYAPGSGSSVDFDDFIISGSVTPNTIPPVITANLTNQTILIGSSATFTVTAASASPITYGWYTNGICDPSASTTSYTFNNAPLADSGRTFRVYLTNSYGISTSALATLTIVDPSVHITANPASYTTNENTTATFTVAVLGQTPFYYQWYSNNVAIPGATSASYTTPTLKPAPYSGLPYKVVVTNSLSSATSAVATVTVTPETVPPHLLSIFARGYYTNSIVLTFDEPVALNPANYTLNNGAMVTNVYYGSSSNVVFLQTAGLSSSNTYTLAMTNVLDMDAQTPNAIVGLTTNFTYAGTLTPGFAYMEVFTGLSAGTTKADFITVAKVTNNQPDAVSYVSSTYWNNSAAVNYGARMSGLFYAPVSGSYTFYIMHDDWGGFRLSTNATPTGLPAGAGTYAIDVAAVQTAYADGANSITNTLVGGQYYYFEAAMKQGGGGEYLGVGVRLPGGSLPTPESPMLGSLIAAYADSVGAIVVITNQPTDANLQEDQIATLTVKATNSPTARPMTYLWQQNNGSGVFTNLLAAPVTSTYTTPVLKIATNQFDVVVATPGAWVTSRVATVSATNDTIPPYITSVVQEVGAGKLNFIQVGFSEAVSTNSATNLLNYALSGGLTFTNAIMLDTRTVRLYASLPLTPTISYTLTASNVADVAVTPNLMASTNYVFYAWYASQSGSARREWFTNLNTASSTLVNALLTHTKFTNNLPDSVDYLTTLNSPQTAPDLTDYGLRLSGYIIPPSSGVYYFQVYSDDEGRFFLSSDDNPANLQLLMRYNDGVCCGGQQFYPNGIISVPVTLVAGRLYYMEALLKEGGGGDQLHVTWQLPGATAFTDVPAANLAFAVRPDYVLRLTQQPANLTVNEDQPAVFTCVGASPELGVAYQWQYNSVNIPNATNSTLVIPVAHPATNGTYRCLVAARVETGTLAGSYPVNLTSSSATLTVIQDVTAPSIVRATSDPMLSHIHLTFSELVVPASATNLASYGVSGGGVCARGRPQHRRQQCGSPHLALGGRNGLYRDQQRHFGPGRPPQCRHQLDSGANFAFPTGLCARGLLLQCYRRRLCHQPDHRAGLSLGPTLPDALHQHL